MAGREIYQVLATLLRRLAEQRLPASVAVAHAWVRKVPLCRHDDYGVYPEHATYESCPRRTECGICCLRGGGAGGSVRVQV
jgi:hypothetical protein